MCDARKCNYAVGSFAGDAPVISDDGILAIARAGYLPYNSTAALTQEQSVIDKC